MDWQKVKQRLANAFAVDDGRESVTDEDIELLDKMATAVVRRGMAAPAILFIESVGPLNFVGSSLMSFLRPVVGLIFNTMQYERAEQLLDKRCSLPLFVERIELAQRRFDDQKKARKQSRKDDKAAD